VVNKKQLKEILQKHSNWLNHIEGGVQADLEGADLRGANLRGMSLERANLKDTNLRGADLRFASLHGADLEGANLYHAGLEDVKGLITWQSPVGIKRMCYSVKHDACIMHKLGCFWGDTDEAIEAIREKYGDNSMYEQLLLLNDKALEIE
jgi:hypothetical protein